VSLFNKLFGRPLASWEERKQRLSVMTGVPALGLDALSSTAYGPEAALLILLPLGAAGEHYFFAITAIIVAQLFILYMSYLQTITAYPNGGGSYIVASNNLGKRVGVWAAVALLIDYILNVCVGIAAGIGVIVSAFPTLQPYTLVLCLFVLLTLTIINLRGVRESGIVFIIPTIIFIVCIASTLGIGFVQTWLSNGHPHAIIPTPTMPQASATLSYWILLGAFANGLTAMTGVEAVSNAVPLFQKPAVKNAHRTLTIIVLTLGLFLLALGYLCPAYHIVAMDESKPGYQTVLSQLVAAVTGRGVFYYIASFSIFIVLTYSAQTSFTDFPRVCRLLAEDNFLPHFFADRGRRLVFTYGIVTLAILSTLILIMFNGITTALIPLFAVGAFAAFIFSQIGMVVYWLKKGQGVLQNKMIFNAAGALSTSLALVVIILAKFIEGAWLVVILIPILVFLLNNIRKHYKKISKEIAEPLALEIPKLSPVVIIPINGWDRVAEKAIQLGLLLSDDVTAIYISTERNVKNAHNLTKIWAEKVERPANALKLPIPKLKIINSPFRQVYQPILDYVKQTREDNKTRLIAVIIPQLVEAHWYEQLLHNIRAAGLRTLLFLQHFNRIVVISTPWYLH